MTNNDILRRLRYAFDCSDDEMIGIFAFAEHTVSRAEVSDWLKKEDDPASRELSDTMLATFLNGFIVSRRGRKDGPIPTPESHLTNNLILTKLKIALSMRSEDLMEVMALTGYRMSKHEMSALFRKPGHKHYRECLDQILRNFLKGLQMKHRPA
jgi:uncharacterized protein YehS (DUF1456 family)